MSNPRLVAVGDHSLNVLSHGKGDRHFTCLHGLVDTLDIWQRVASPLEERGGVTRIDQRGHGISPAPEGPYTRAELAEDVMKVLEAEGIEQTILVGHSMGGIVAMEAALNHPERVEGLLLIGTTSECREKVAGWYERIALAGEEEGCAGLGRAIYGEKSKKQIVGDARGIAHVTRMLKSLYDDPLTPRLSNIDCPTLLVVGDKDPMGPKASEIIHSTMSSELADLVRVPDKGHWLHLDATTELVGALDRWLEKWDL